ncbi:MAG TPA: hypothetical protein VHU40_14470, partial [Polyangia bacterium]|nr:hypothetical protein [Polyangia bacterium]
MGGTPAGGKGGASATAGKSGSTGGSAGGSGLGGAGGVPHASGGFGGSPTISSCPILPSNHLFNTPIDTLPVDPRSAQYLATIGAHKLHMDFGMSTNIAMPDEYYGIPFNVIHGSTASWVGVRYASADPDLVWDPREESDCVDSASGAAHTKISPCTMAAAPNPVFPIPAMPLVEGGIDTNPSQPYGDHHILLIDVDACQLYELYHAYPRTGGSGMWDIFGSVRFDLRSNTLRPDGWTSSDAAGFPIFPLLLRADEA